MQKYTYVLINFLTIIICFIFSFDRRIQFYKHFATFFKGSIVVAYKYYITKVSWIGKGSFVYLCLMPGFFMVNGVLTGTGLDSPIVNYNSDQILNIRMLTIPIEDAVYGYAQFMLNIYFFKRFQKND